jgi:hypothetical protein
MKSTAETPVSLWKGKCIASARHNRCSEQSLMLRTEGQLRTFNRLQAFQGHLRQSRQAPTHVRQASTQVRPTPAHVSKGLDVATEHFQQMLLKDNLPWVPEQLKPQATDPRAPQITEQASNETMSQRPRNHLPRRLRGLNPEAIEFQIPQINEQASNSATSQAPQSEVSARNSTMSYATERIKKLEDEVATLKMALKEQIENCICKKEERKWEDVMRKVKVEELNSGSDVPISYLAQINDHTDVGTAGRDLRKPEFSRELSGYASSTDLIEL